jgi:hypothetical protein
MVTEISVRGIRVSKGEHLLEKPISTFSTNCRVNLEFRIHAALRSLDCPMQEMVTLELTSENDPLCRYLFTSSEIRGLNTYCTETHRACTHITSHTLYKNFKQPFA